MVTQTFFSRVFLIIFLSVQFQTLMVWPQSLKPQKDQIKLHGFAKSYLKAYGYLRDNDDDDVESGIRKFQEFYHLNVSGKLDPETIKAMGRPRCGVPDNMSSRSLFNNSKYAFFSGKPTWPPSKRRLTYSFDPLGINGGVSLSELRQAFLLAFGQWTRVTKFTFNEIVTGKTDIVIGLYRRDHGDGKPFDGPGGIWAHAFAPTDGRLHFDAEEKWSDTEPVPKDRVDLVTVGLHEAGHILGLQHSQDKNAVMYAFIGAGESKRVLNSDDIAGIHALYPN